MWRLNTSERALVEFTVIGALTIAGALTCGWLAWPKRSSLAPDVVEIRSRNGRSVRGEE